MLYAGWLTSAVFQRWGMCTGALARWPHGCASRGFNPYQTLHAWERLRNACRDNVMCGMRMHVHLCLLCCSLPWVARTFRGMSDR